MARACPEASGACNVRHRAFASWSMHGDVIAHAGKAQHRLHTSYRRLAMRARPQIAVAAVARALAGYLRAAMQDTPESVAVA